MYKRQVHDYLIREVQRTYRMQGVDVNDKHIEVIVRQMMKKVKDVYKRQLCARPFRLRACYSFPETRKTASLLHFNALQKSLREPSIDKSV